MITLGGKEYAESPLEGALLCCTSISPEDRAQLAEYAQEMGAKHTLDLTSDVTHLLVGNTDSKKYQYVAKEREDVKVLLPQWVHAIRNKWMADEVIDLNAMDAEHKCPTLYGLKICITGFEDLDFRNELARNIAKHGGQYTGDLTKDVTHLIAFTPQGKKYDYAGSWGIKIVSLKWYKDTLDRGMQLDESLYHPAMPPEHQGRGAWNRQSPGSSRLGKRQRTDLVAEEPGRKLRRAASAKFSGQQNDMWNDIVGHPPPADSDSGTNTLRSTKSMSNVQPKNDLHTNPELNVKESVSVQAQTPVEDPIPNVQSHREGFLAGKHFAQKGFEEAQKSLLFAALAGLGATLHQSVSELFEGVDDDDRSRFLIVPHTIKLKEFAMVSKTLRDTSIVTELWLEYCMTVKAFVSPESYALASPICPTDIPGISKLVVNASGFHQVQTMHIAKTVRKLGATYQENFSPQTSVLVINPSNLNQQKILHATSWKVPVVTEKWLWKLIATNRIPSFESFAVIKPNQGSKPEDPKLVQVLPDDQETSSHQAGDERNVESGHENTFVEAARAIEAREKQAALNKQRDSNKPAQDRPQPGVEHQHIARAERRKSHNSPGPLQEISANIAFKAQRSVKKKLFRQFDGATSDHIGPLGATFEDHIMIEDLDQEPAPLLHENQEEAPRNPSDEPQPVSDLSASTSVEVRHSSNNDLLKEFFEIKAAAEARKSLTSSNDSKTKKKNLLGRAISNLSNSSRKSTEDNNLSNESNKVKQSLSRASSINSLNTDGLGVPLSALSRIPSELLAKDTTSTHHTNRPNLTGNAKANLTRSITDPVLTDSNINSNPIPTDPTSAFHAALATLSNSQLPRPPTPPRPAQLTYADTDEAAKLKAHLAEKRRTRARLGQERTDPAPEMSVEEKERRRMELAREESDEMRQARWRAEREGGVPVIKDDERVVGVGRRTRGREKRVSALGGGFEEGVGGGVFEGM